MLTASSFSHPMLASIQHVHISNVCLYVNRVKKRNGREKEEEEGKNEAWRREMEAARSRSPVAFFSNFFLHRHVVAVPNVSYRSVSADGLTGGRTHIFHWSKHTLVVRWSEHEGWKFAFSLQKKNTQESWLVLRHNECELRWNSKNVIIKRVRFFLDKTGNMVVWMKRSETHRLNIFCCCYVSCRRVQKRLERRNKAISFLYLQRADS